MAQEVHGDYAAYTTPGGVRYQHKGKLVSVNAVPPEVAQLLAGKLEGKPRGELATTAPERPKPTPEQLAAIKAEQLAPKPGLEADAQKLADDAANAADRLTAEDFDEPPVPVDPSPPEEDEPPAELVTTTEQFLEEAPPQTQEHPTEKAKRETKEDMSDFLESVSIHSASLEDIAHALYNRFGIYTVYLNKFPETDEVNPLTAVPFTKYHQGIAYQAALYAQANGLLHRPAESNRKQLDEGRAASQNMQMDTPPQTMGQARRANSFDFRTSAKGNDDQPTTEIVHVKNPETGIIEAVQRVIPAGEVGEFNGAGQRFDKEEEEPIVEPRFGKQVIRPNW